MALYQREQFEGWLPLDEHLKNPVNFPVGITSGFLVVYSAPPGNVVWKTGDPVLFLGEIPGMKGHGIFAGSDGLVKWGYHTSNFHVIPKDEL